MAGKTHIPPNLVVRSITAHRKPPDVRICRLRNQSRVGTVPPSTSTPTLAGMLRAPLVGHQVVQMGEPPQKRLLAAFRMMEALHHAQLPLDGVMGLIQHGARHRASGGQPAPHTSPPSSPASSAA